MGILTLAARMAMGAALTALPAVASAGVYRILYTGVVSIGEDLTGQFGEPGGDLGGEDFRLEYLFTYPSPDAFILQTPTRFSMAGGETFGAASFMEASLTINGRTEQFFGKRQSSTDRFVDVLGYYDQIFHESADGDPFAQRQVNRYVQAGIASEINDFLNTTDPTAPLFYKLQPGDTSLGGFVIFDYDVETDTLHQSASGNFRFTSVMVGSPTIPEPATWGLMIMGFGLVGLTARRRTEGLARAQR